MWYRLFASAGSSLPPWDALSGLKMPSQLRSISPAATALQLVGYLFAPGTSGPHPAVVMLHGRAGPYSANINEDCTLVARDISSPCNASSLSKRHAAWGDYWAGRGYLALLPDSFGPRNKAHGFGRFSHDDPDRDDVNERSVRPLDAEGALSYLRSRADVVPDHIFLQGWSNGGSTVLNVMVRQAAKPAGGFRAAMALYPGCGPRALISQDYKAASPVTVFLASDDEEVSPVNCHRVLDAARNGAAARSTSVDYIGGATHILTIPEGSVSRSRPTEPPAMTCCVAPPVCSPTSHRRSPRRADR